MSITNINPASTMQTSLLQEMQQMKAITQATVHPSATIAANGSLSGASPVSFDQVFKSVLSHVDQLQQVAEQKQTAVDMGKSDDLAGAMIAGQQAALSFSALVQVRNKISTGFNDLMSMSI